MTFKPVMKLDPRAKILRLFRILWIVGTVGKGDGYSAKLSFGLQPKGYQFRRAFNEWILVILGLRLHKKKSYGGYII